MSVTTLFSTDYLSVDGIFSIEDGLSQTRINTIFQDKTGYIWIGTRNGLNRYDGYNFKKYSNQSNDSTSLANNYIRSICDDNFGRLWIANDFGLSVYFPEKDIFKNIKTTANNTIEPVYNVYQTKDGWIWAKTKNSLVKIDPNTFQTTIYEHYSDAFTFVNGDNLYPILEDKNGMLWVGTKDGLTFFDRQLDIFQRFTADNAIPGTLCDNIIKALYEDSSGKLWVGTNKGLCWYDKTNRVFVKYPFYINNEPYSPSVTVINEDFEGNIWVGDKIGVFKIDKSKGAVIYDEIYYKNRPYSITQLTAIYRGNSNLLWIGSFNGLVKIDAKGKKFNLYKKAVTSIPNLSGNAISSVLYDEKDGVWMGIWGNGLNYYNRTTKEVLIYSTLKKDNDFKINNDNVFSLCLDNSKTLWIGTDNGVNLKKPYDNQIYDLCRLYPNGVNCDLFLNNRINTIIEGEQNFIWFGTNRGLLRLNRIEQQIDVIDKVSYTQEKRHNRAIFSIVKDNNNILWIGTDNGLVKYDINNDIVEDIHYSQQHNDASNAVYSLSLEGDLLWIGDYNGLSSYNTKTKAVKNFNHFNKNIYAIQYDKNGELWLSSNMGLLKFNPITENITNFDISDGLQGYEFIVGSSYKSKSGEMFFGGISGLNSFVPDSMLYNDKRPNVVFTAIELYHPSGLKEKPVITDVEYIIPPNVSMFSVSFSALDFTYPLQNSYYYRIYRYNSSPTKWVPIGNQHEVNFTNLAQGKYLLEVMGTNNDKVKGVEPAQMRLYIQVPWYSNYIAFIVYVSIFIAFVFLYIRLRTRRLRESTRLLKEKDLAVKKIEKQREELSVKNKDITDSINYAKRIQEAMMPSLSLFKKCFTDAFVLYKPKSIVSGDFYWINERGSKIFVAVVDCTGHGVPGAFMSLIGIELFRRITAIRGIEQPSQILNILNENFSKIFSDESNITLRDGMDLALCVIDKKNKTIEFAGAFNPLYIIRDYKIIEIKGDRFSVGLEDGKANTLSFMNHVVDYEDNDVLYMFSDGYPDQFGGPNNQKYKKRRFRHLLLNVHKYPLDKQMEYLNDSIEMWQGENEQVDDILVIGIKP